MVDSPRKHWSRLTKAEKAVILDLHAAGTTRNDIARQTGVAAATVTKVVHEARGKDAFNRSATKAATQSRQADLAEKRTTVQEQQTEIMLLAQAKLLDTMRDGKKWQTVLRNSDGAEVEKLIGFIPSVDFQRYANASVSMASAIEKLARIDAGSGEDAARSLLGGLAIALGLVTDDDPA